MKYFAYGSNMNPERMKERGINFSQMRRAKLEGYNLVFNKIASRNPKEGYANVMEDINSFAEGVLYDITDSDIKKLDKYEGHPQHYKKSNIKVLLDNKHEVNAITYIASPDKVKYGLKPSREYLNHLLAAKDVLSESYYAVLKKQETLD